MTETMQRIRTLEADAERLHAVDDERTRLAVSLILGEAQILGKRVELHWPDGLPHGFTEETLREYARGLVGHG